MGRSVRLVLLAAVAAIVALAVPAGAGAFGPLGSFGSEGVGAGQFNRMSDLAVAADGTVYVADSGTNRVNVFSPEGGFLFAFGKNVNATMGGADPDLCTAASGCVIGTDSPEAGALREPEDLAIAPNGNVHVIDQGQSRVNVFSPQGDFLFAFGKEVNPGGGDVCTVNCQIGRASGAGGLSSPRGIAIDGGRVFVVENATHRVSVFTEAGQFLFAFGKRVNLAGIGGPVPDPNVCTVDSGCREGDVEGAGALKTPHRIAIAAGRVYVPDGDIDRVSVYSTEGQFLFAFGKGVNPQGGDVCDLASGCDPGEDDRGAGEMDDPKDVVVGADGLVYVGDSLGRLSVFTPAGAFLRAFGLGVVDGAPVFQQCTAATGCRVGLSKSTAPGSLAEVVGLAAAPSGAIYVAEDETDVKNRVEILGEPVAPQAPQPPAKPSNRFGFGKLKLNKRKGTATLAVAVPGAGALRLAGKGVRPIRAAAPRAATVRLTVKLAGSAKKRLLARGKAKVRVAVTFTPSGGDALTRGRALVLKKSLRSAPRR